MLVHELHVSLNTLELGAGNSGKIRITPLLHSASKGDIGIGRLYHRKGAQSSRRQPGLG